MTASIAAPGGSKARLFEHKDVRVRAGPPGARSAAESSQPDVGETVMPGANGFGYFCRNKSSPRRGTARKKTWMSQQAKAAHVVRGPLSRRVRRGDLSLKGKVKSRSPARRLLQQRGEVLADLLRRVGRRVAAHDLAFAIHQELGEVPLDRLGAEQAGRLVLEVFVKRVRVPAVDLGLGEQREADVVVDRAEVADRLRVARLLVAELVAGEPEHREALILALTVQRLKPRVL